MGTLQGKGTRGKNGARRFEPSSEAKAGPVLTQVEESRPSAPAERETLGRLVAARRAELGLAHRDLAKRMDVSRGTIARIERGEPQSTETLTRLTKALRPGEGTALAHALESELLLRGAISGSLATSAASRRRRPSMPHVSIPRPSVPRPSIPRVSLPRLSFSRRWLLGSAAAAVALIAVVAVVAIASSGDGGGADPAPQPAQVVSAAPVAAPAPEPKKAKKADKAEKAERNAAPVSDGEESSSSDETSSSDEPSSGGDGDSGGGGDGGLSQPSTPVATPPPAPSGGGGGGRPPGILHGIDPGAGISP